jgi:hypothetical protein
MIPSPSKVISQRHYLRSTLKKIYSIPAAGSTFAAFELTRGGHLSLKSEPLVKGISPEYLQDFTGV